MSWLLTHSAACSKTHRVSTSALFYHLSVIEDKLGISIFVPISQINGLKLLYAISYTSTHTSNIPSASQIYTHVYILSSMFALVTLAGWQWIISNTLFLPILFLVSLNLIIHCQAANKSEHWACYDSPSQEPQQTMYIYRWGCLCAVLWCLFLYGVELSSGYDLFLLLVILCHVTIFHSTNATLEECHHILS